MQREKAEKIDRGQKDRMRAPLAKKIKPIDCNPNERHNIR
jgi:hypothetical protein